MLSYYKKDTLEAGVDEVGRGTLISDVFAAAVILPQDLQYEEEAMILNDSKKLSRRKRLILKDYIEENAIDYSVAQVSNDRIDEINILHASMEAMHKALNGLNVEPEFILVDGNYFKKYKDNNNVIVPYQCFPGGDGIYESIAAASILAKVYHDKYIEELCDKYEDLHEKYDLRNNMGYGTKKHMDGIKEYGISELHRKSFAPCHVKN